jgi:hypothetical protein
MLFARSAATCSRAVTIGRGTATVSVVSTAAKNSSLPTPKLGADLLPMTNVKTAGQLQSCFD